MAIGNIDYDDGIVPLALVLRILYQGPLVSFVNVN